MHQFTVSSAVGDQLNVSITGPNADEFDVVRGGARGDASTTTCEDDNGPSASCLLDVVFSPTSRGIKTATLVVVNRFAHAQRTQRPFIAWLQQHGIEYRSFYIVNAIWVKADRGTALALAARSDVARLDGNPPIDNGFTQPQKSLGPQPGRTESIEPGIQDTRAPQVWDLGFTGQGIVVGGQDYRLSLGSCRAAATLSRLEWHYGYTRL